MKYKIVPKITLKSAGILLRVRARHALHVRTHDVGPLVDMTNSKLDQCRLWLVLASARALLRHEVLYFMIRGASSAFPYAAVCSKIMTGARSKVQR